MAMRVAPNETLDGVLTTLIENDAGGSPVYVGLASPGHAGSEAVWRIKKIAYDAGGSVVSVTFAAGDSAFDKVWDHRAGYVYA